MSKQYLFFMLQNLFIGICGLVDTAFGNHIDLDSLCAMSAFSIINLTTYVTYQIGSYAYRVTLSKAKMCFVIQLVISGVLTVVLLFSSEYAAHLYSLTDNQYALLTDCIRIHALTCPILAIREFLGNYAEYKCENKHALIGNIILYGSMILTDALVVLLHGSLRELILFTGVCSLIYAIYEYRVLSFRKEEWYFNWRELFTLLKHGFNTWVDRISGRVAVFVYGIYASKLGSELYSIHSVCYATAIFTECFTNAIHTHKVVTTKGTTALERFKHCMNTRKIYIIFSIFGAYVLGYAVLLFVHADVPLIDCVGWLSLYLTQVFALTLYEILRAYLVLEHETKYIRYCGMFGIVIRVPFIIIGYYLNLGLFPFAFACLIDFGIRALYCYYASKRVQKKAVVLEVQ